MRFELRTVILAGTVALLGGCDAHGWEDSMKVTEDFHYTYDLQPGGRLSVENFNGSVEVMSWDQPKIEVNGTKYAPSKEELSTLKVEVAVSGGVAEVRTIRPSEPLRRGSLGVKYRIHVPRQTALDRVLSSNGAVRVQAIEGNAKIKTSNGAVKVVEHRGDVDITTSNGGVELDRFQGAATVATSNGAVTATGVKGYVEASTTNGAIRVGVTQLEGGRPVRLRTSNGPVTLTLDDPKGSDVIARTTNGSITVKLASTVNARVKAHTSNASISTDVPLSAVTEQSKTRLEGSIGSGGPVLDLATSNGAIRIARN